VVIINSYIKSGDQFVKIEDLNAAPPDLNYIEGYIFLSVNDTIILNETHYDLVDQLWFYFAQGIIELKRGNAYDTYFPDQPLHFVVGKADRTGFAPISVATDGKIISAKVYIPDLIESAVSECVKFFSILSKLIPSRQHTYNEVIHSVANY
jgi:hypothetical protein